MVGSGHRQRVCGVPRGRPFGRVLVRGGRIIDKNLMSGRAGHPGYATQYPEALLCVRRSEIRGI